MADRPEGPFYSVRFARTVITDSLMTERWTTAVPTYCHACGYRIELPGTFKVVKGHSYHDGCIAPYLGPHPITVGADGECADKEK